MVTWLRRSGFTGLTTDKTRSFDQLLASLACLQNLLQGRGCRVSELTTQTTDGDASSLWERSPVVVSFSQSRRRLAKQVDQASDSLVQWT